MEITTKKTVIGVANLKYDEKGKLKNALFNPAIRVTMKDLKGQLDNCIAKTDEEIKDSAKLLMAAFFNKISDIELRDMETTDIETNIIKRVNNTIRIEFTYKQK